MVVKQMVMPAAHQVVNFKLSDLPDRVEPTRVLMCSPDYFDVVDVKNVHMEGQAGKVNKPLALSQWAALRDGYTRLQNEGLLDDVLVISGDPDCEDMVFTANQSFPWIRNGEKVVIMSKMRHESRKKEVGHFRSFYETQGYRPIDLRHTEMFEGMGDMIPHPGKSLLYGGFGHRTTREAYDEIAVLLDVPVVLLELVDARFYHLDTCFVPLDEETVMLCPEAFSLSSFRAIEKLFSHIIRIPATEASATFALNAHVLSFPRQKRRFAFIQYGSTFAYQALRATGHEVIEVDTGEFMKSGGSVFCMKMMMY